MTITEQAPATQDIIERIAALPPRQIIALLLWKDRHRNPGLTQTITAKDLEGLEACLNYLKTEGEVSIVRPAGRPAQPAFTSKEQGAQPARPADPPRDFVVVALVEKGSATPGVIGNAITPVENNEEDAKLADRARLVAQIKPTVPRLAAALANEQATGDISLATCNDVIEALRILGA